MCMHLQSYDTRHKKKYLVVVLFIQIKLNVLEIGTEWVNFEIHLAKHLEQNVRLSEVC